MAGEAKDQPNDYTQLEESNIQPGDQTEVGLDQQSSDSMWPSWLEDRLRHLSNTEQEKPPSKEK